MNYNRNTWNYDYPSCLWEQWPWWFRWPVAVLAAVYFGGGFAVPFILMMR